MHPGPIEECLSGRISPPVAVARLLLSGAGAAAIRAGVEAARPNPPTPGWQALHAILDRRDAALDRLAAELRTAVGEHATLHRRDAGTMGRVATFFDRAASAWPEAGVALYSLGDPALLEAATAEVAAWLHDRALLRDGLDVLDLGCGTGRLLPALAAHARTVLGLDVSPGMVAAARARCALPNVRVAHTDGQGLDALPAASLDLVLAVDSFPYIVSAGPDVLERHLRGAARALRPGGTLVVLNFSYRGDTAADTADAGSVPELTLVEAGTRPFGIWDGVAYILRR